MKILFWNIKGECNNLQLALKYGDIHKVDLIAVCETVKEKANLNLYKYFCVEHVDLEHNDIDVFIRQGKTAKYTHEAERYCILNTCCANRILIMAIIHLNSPLTSNYKSYQATDITKILGDIEKEEGKNNTNRSLVFGDFNMHIFDEKIVDFNGFNARLFRHLADKQSKKRHNCVKDIFYSPMLRLFKDSNHRLKNNGSYFNLNDNIQWICNDQVLLKNQLIKLFDISKLKYLDSILGNRLIKNYKIKSEYSDHLPLYFEIKEK